jgi:hypothetical protein
VGTQIVISCRAPHGAAAEGGYLERARALVARGEALGAHLVAWSATTLALAWDAESIEEAITFVSHLHEDDGEETWACGIAEGEMEPLSTKGKGDLSWGVALATAVSLARVAAPGEVLLDGDMRAVRVGELAVLGTRAATDAGKRVRGWKLNLKAPWHRPTSMRAPPPPDYGDEDERTLQTHVPIVYRSVPPPNLEFSRDEVGSEVLELVEAAASQRGSDLPPSNEPSSDEQRDSGRMLVEKIKTMAGQVDPVIALKKARARAEEASPRARCHASLALGVALAMAGRCDEALLEGMDALARAREGNDMKGTQACLAFLAKLYATTGRMQAADRLRNIARP